MCSIVSCRLVSSVPDDAHNQISKGTCDMQSTNHAHANASLKVYKRSNSPSFLQHFFSARGDAPAHSNQATNYSKKPPKFASSDFTRLTIPLSSIPPHALHEP